MTLIPGEQFRARCLQGIAEAMAQLNKLSFERGGALSFDKDGNVSGVGARYYADFNAFHRKLYAKEFSGDGFFPFHEAGPLTDVGSYFLSALDQRPGPQGRTPFRQGAYILLRHLIDWSLIDPTTSPNRAFVLAHPDFDTHNIFTDEDGTLTGIIDWHWVAAVPRSVGCLKLPNFLMRDFDPECYDFDAKAGRPDDGCDECSPAELRCYRAMYSQFVEQYLGKQQADATRRSLVMHSLDVAASNPRMTLSMVCHLFDEIEHLTATEEDLDNSDTVSEASTEADGEEDENDIDHMSFDDCLREIEKLTAPVSVDASLLPIADQTAPESLRAHRDSKGPSAAGSKSVTTSTKKESYGRKIGRVACRWSSKKLRAAAQRLHRVKPMVDQPHHEHAIYLESCETAESRKSKVSRIICEWTQRRLKQVIRSLHRKTELKSTQCLGQRLHLRVKKGLRAVIEWLHEKLGQMINVLHRKQQLRQHDVKEDIDSKAAKIASSRHQVKGSDDMWKKAACGQIACMLKNDNFLTDQALQAIARWVVRNLRSEDQETQSTGGISDCDYATRRLEEYQEHQQSLEEHYHKQALKKAATIYTPGDDSSPDSPPDEEKENKSSSIAASYFDIIFPNHNRWQDISTQRMLGNEPFVDNAVEGTRNMGDHRPINVAQIDE